MNKYQKNIQLAISIDIAKRPLEVDISNIEINQGECFINSYRVAKQNVNVKIIEGLIIALDNENRAKPMPHVWNKLNDIYFDVTKEEVWNDRIEIKEAKEIKYFMVKIHSSNDFQSNDIFEFCEATYQNINVINMIITEKNKK